jgi:hypothetical protein
MRMSDGQSKFARAGPQGHAKLECRCGRRGFEAQPGQRLGARRTIAGPLEARPDSRLGVRRHILPHDGMVEDRRASLRWLAEFNADPFGGVGLIDPWTVGAREVDGAFQTRQALTLIGPDIGSEAKALGRIFEIDWRDVASMTLDHPERGVDRRRRAFPPGREADRAVRVAPADRAETIVVAIPDGVKARARADFKTPERQASHLGDLQKTSDKYAGSTNLVRLWGRDKKSANGAAMFSDDVENDGPQWLDWRRARRIARDKRRRRPGQGERVQRSRHPESQGVGDRIARPPERQLRAGPAGCDVVSQDREKPRREWRGELFTPPDLLVERVENRLPILIGI